MSPSGCNRSVTLSLRVKQVDGNTDDEFERAAEVRSDVDGACHEVAAGARRGVMEVEPAYCAAAVEALSSPRGSRTGPRTARAAQQSFDQGLAQTCGAGALC